MNKDFAMSGILTLGRLFVFLVVAACGFRAPSNTFDAKILSQDNGAIVLEYSIHDYDVVKVKRNDAHYVRVSVPGTTSLRELGLPEVPSLPRDILVSDNVEYGFSMLEMDWHDANLGIPVPSAGDLQKSENVETQLMRESDFYHSGKSFPENVFELGKPFVMRDVRGLKTRFNPFRFNSRTGLTRVVTHLKVAIKPLSATNAVSELENERRWSPEFFNIYSSHFWNGERDSGTREIRQPSGAAPVAGIVIVTADVFKEAMMPYVRWKIERGIPTKIVTMSEIGGKKTANDVYAFLKKEYESTRMAHILLVGDAEFVPPRKGTEGNVLNRAADPTYGNLAGDDFYPEAIVSRFSAKTTKDVEVMVARTLQYEKHPDTSDDWMSHHLGIASNERYSDNMPKDWERMRALQDVLRSGDFVKFTEVFDPGARANVIFDALQQGVGFVDYIGHGTLDTWVTSGFSNLDIARLTNKRWPYVLSVACVNGAFATDIGDAFGEAFTKAGTPENPAGAIGIFASSTSQSWVPPAKGQRRAVELLARHAKTSVGELFFAASVAALEDNSNTAAQTFQSWHIFGDGTAIIHTKKPITISPRIPSAPQRGQQVFRLDSVPEGAMVGISADGILLVSGYATSAGEYVADLNVPQSTSQLRITVSGHNILPMQRDYFF